MRSYKELIKIPTFFERYEYLRCHSAIGIETFGSNRFINQQFYNSVEWKQIRYKVIVRDDGCDLAMPDRPIYGKIYIHHMNPLLLTDIVQHSDSMFDIDQLICCSFETHNAIHYGDKSLLVKDIEERKPGDTIPWR